MNQDKIDYINYAHNEEITYWKKAALERDSSESKEKEWRYLAPSRASLIRKYSPRNEEPRIFNNDILSEEPSFKAIIDYLKTFPKSIKEDENMSLKRKCLIGRWSLMASKVYRICLVDLKTGHIACEKEKGRPVINTGILLS